MDKPFALLIEDDRDVATLFRHVMDMAGYRSEIIYDGIEAMKRLSNIEPDLVVLDLQLPGISGVEILQKMRTDERMKTIPVIIVTATDNLETAVDCDTADPESELYRSCCTDELARTVQERAWTSPIWYLPPR